MNSQQKKLTLTDLFNDCIKFNHWFALLENWFTFDCSCFASASNLRWLRYAWATLRKSREYKLDVNSKERKKDNVPIIEVIN